MVAKKKLIRLREVLELIGVKRATLYDWLNPNSPRHDPEFPKQIRLGAASVAWVVEELEAWIEKRIAARDGFQ